MTARIHPDLLPLAVPIAELRPMAGNARYHDSESVESIKGSLLAYGQRKPIVVREDGEIIAGNGTYESFLELGWDTIAVVRVSEDRTTSLAYSIADNRSGDLSEWAASSLRAAMEELEGTDLFTGFTDSDLAEMLEELEGQSEDGGGGGGKKDDEGDDPNYERKVEAPIYEPKKDESPALTELTEESKVTELLSEIEGARVPEDVKEFLRRAAERHRVFDYEQIAEYYCHAPANVQRLMENSALVIIDFDKAIEKGFVKLVGELGRSYDSDKAAALALEEDLD